MANSYPDQHTQIRRQLLIDAQTELRHAREDRRQAEEETEAIRETVTYGIGILLLCLLIVLMLTPTG